MARGERTAARSAFTQAISLDPRNAFAWANLGATEMLLGNTAKARQAYDRALEADSDNWLANYNLSAYFARRGNRNAALDHLQRCFATLRRNGSRLELDSVLRDLQSNSAFNTMRHDSRFSNLIASR